MKKKQMGTIFIALIFGGSFLAYALSYSMPAQRNGGRISRARVQISTCDNVREIPVVQVKNKSFLFNSTSEGIIEFSGGEINLGRVFDLLNLTFSQTRLLNYTNDNECPDLPSNEIHLFVRSYEEERFKQSNRFRSYRVNNGDIIRVSYY